ncbi:MAG TPA: response regulator transcription factor [Terriglobales bacterium]
MLRIFVAEHDQVVRQVLTGIVNSQKGWEVCGEAADAIDLAEKVREVGPDLVLLDIGLTNPDGLVATRQIVDDNPGQNVLVMGMSDPFSVGREAFEAGALGYVPKRTSVHDLVPAIKALQKGRTSFTARVAESILREYLDQANQNGSDHVPLSERQSLAIQLLAREAATASSQPPPKPRAASWSSVRYLVLTIAVVGSVVVGWSTYHETLEQRLPVINKLQVRLGLRPPPPKVVPGNPETRVWIDLHTGLYYCPGADVYGRTARGRFARQKDAQLDQFQPANRRVCE